MGTNAPFGYPVRFATDASNNITGLVGPGGNVASTQKGVGHRCLLLGDSMTMAHNNTFSAGSLTFQRSSNVVEVSYTGHLLLTGERINVNGFSSTYGFNANNVAVTWLTANSFSYPSVGADTAAIAGTNSTSTNPITILGRKRDQGWMHHANHLLGGGLQIVQNLGVGSDTVAMMRARLNEVDAYLDDFDILCLHGGYNSANNGTSAADTWADMKFIIDKYLGLGKTVLLFTAFPVGSGSTAAIRERLIDLRKYQLAYSRPGLIVVDGYLDAIDPSSASGYAKANMTGDGVHPSAKLARLVGQRAATALSAVVNVPTRLATSAADNYATSSTSRQCLNACWSGTGGTTTTFGGTAPSGSLVDRTSANLSSATVTAPARADGFGYDVLVESLVSSGAGELVIRFTLPAGSYAAGDILNASAEVTITGGDTHVYGVYAQMVQAVSGMGSGYAYDCSPSANNTEQAYYGGADTTAEVVTTGDMVVVAGVTSIYFDVRVACSTTGGTLDSVRVGRPAVYKNTYNTHMALS